MPDAPPIAVTTDRAVNAVEHVDTDDRHRVGGSLAFWVVSIGTIGVALAVAYFSADLIRQVDSAHRDVALANARVSEANRKVIRAQTQLSELNQNLISAKTEISNLCNFASDADSYYSRPKFRDARDQLGDIYLDKVGKIKSLACELDRQSEAAVSAAS
jgi:hypothetical protein